MKVDLKNPVFIVVLTMIVTLANVDAANNRKTQPATTATIDKDPILKAFKDELAVSMKQLKLDGRSPFYMSYMVKDEESFALRGSFAGLKKLTDQEENVLNLDIRIGTYQSNHPYGISVHNGNNLSPKYSYDSLPQAAWLDTYNKYKQAIENAQNSSSFHYQRAIANKPVSISCCKQTISIQAPVRLDINKGAWQKSVSEIVNVFRSYPKISAANVSVSAHACTRRFANTEGSFNREGNSSIELIMTATAIAKDGMKVHDFERCVASNENELPALSELKDSACNLAKRVSELVDGSVAESYHGPILFEKQAAAELFAQTLEPELVNTSSGLGKLPFEVVQIDKRILPESFRVVDNPFAQTFKGNRLNGGYLADDEGVGAEKLILVENGILKTVCSGRRPSKYINKSNGHWRDMMPCPSQLFISSSDTMSLDSLRKKLLKKGKEKGLKYVLVVRHIGSMMDHLSAMVPADPAAFLSTPWLQQYGNLGDEVMLTSPTLLYKVDVDTDREELVRGARFMHLTKGILKEIDGAGDDAAVYPVCYQKTGNLKSASLIAPSVIISQINVEPELSAENSAKELQEKLKNLGLSR